MSGTAPVTAIIPTFNRAILLPETIASILAQTTPPERILVIDDGSTDATHDAVAGFGASVTYIHRANGGKAAALNTGLGVAVSDFIWVVDDDDIAEPTGLARLTAALQTHPAMGFSFGDYLVFEDAADGTRHTHEIRFPAIAPDEVFRTHLGRYYIHQPGLLVRRSAYEAVGPFDEAMVLSEDFEMLMRLARRYPGVQVTDGPVFRQRKHALPRGRSGEASENREKAWKPYNQEILRRLRRDCELAEFVPRPTPGPLGPRDRFTALLQRSTMLGRRGVWDLAADDLEAAMGVAAAEGIGELRQVDEGILHGLFDPWSEGAPDYAAAVRFRAVLQGPGSARLKRRLRQAMADGLPHLLRDAVKQRNLAKVAALTKMYVQLCPMEGIAGMLWTKALK